MWQSLSSIEKSVSQSVASADSVLGNEHLIKRLDRKMVPRSLIQPIYQELLSAGVFDQGARVLASRMNSSDCVFSTLNSISCQTFYGHLFPHLSDFKEILFSKATKEKGLAVVFDYDVDGVTSAAQLKHFLDIFGIKSTWMTPRRERDGYGVKRWMIDAAARRQHNALITLDCGTADNDCLTAAQDQGLKTVVIDHHVPTHEAPPGLIFNPFVNQIEELKVRSASGLVHDVLMSLLAIQEHVDNKNIISNFYSNSLALATLGTVADVMKIQGVNRILVSQGLIAIRNSSLPGIQSLRMVSKKRGAVDTQEIGFNLGPRINAPGRMDENEGAMLPFKLLTTLDEAHAVELATSLNGWNIRRQDRELIDVQNAVTQALEDHIHSSGICIFNPEYHLGVVGLVASRLCQKFDVPVLVLGKDSIRADQGILKGSLRVPEGYNGLELLSECQEALIQYGGHLRAGGVSMYEDYLPHLTRLFSNASYKQAKHLPDQRASNTIFYDDDVPLKSIGLELARNLREFGPYGEGFPNPVFMVKNVVLSSPRQIGNHSLEVTARQFTDSVTLRLRGIKEQSALRYGIPCNLALSLYYAEVDGREYCNASIEALQWL